MADIILIDTYRGVEVFFNKEGETFYASVDDPELHWNRPKKTYASVLKTIDEYVKEHLKFVPFNVLFKGWSCAGDKYEVRKITGIRKDGQFVYEDDKGVQRQLSKYDENKCYLDIPENHELITEMAANEKKRAEYQKKLNEAQSKLQSLDLKEIKDKYIV